ncbi:hypothetical protein GCM10010124_09550 [Pilimelia terevasa]|uniref:EAL domain-containing protein n=1 Tax=Pilimelia terevasa TaxID=53372 RepID=A0A8J3BG49_9ACTN|nr:EAL domain-containing protein [Pilimelia terevasa]GGK19039.1 hypothetical protein GCM10010124_09550 [Pilimelia terevasa]
MGRQRTAAGEQVAELLLTARRSLGLSVAFLSRLDDDLQHLEVVESSVPLLFREGVTQPRATTFCQAVLDRRLPAVMADVRQHPTAMRLPAARMPRIRSFVSVPVTLSDGSLYGTFCAAGLTSDKDLTARDEALMNVLAAAAAVVVEPEVREAGRRAEIDARLDEVVGAGGPTVLLQPIVALPGGVRVGAEALSRFPAAWQAPPDACFAQAHSVDRGAELELAALRGAAAHLDAVAGYVSMNLSPGVLLHPDGAALLATLPLDRVVLELSEHDPVADYEALTKVLAPLRAGGMRLAVDDVGAGFASMRHIVLTAPDLLKLDRSIVDGIHADQVLTTLVGSLVTFGHGCGAAVVAEGVETAEDAAALHALGVDYAQGWLYGRPGPPEALTAVG